VGIGASGGSERTAYKFLERKGMGKGLLGRRGRKCLDNIKTDLVDKICGCVDWIGLDQTRDKWRSLVNAAMNLQVL
jgi:hypothetical protein